MHQIETLNSPLYVVFHRDYTFYYNYYHKSYEIPFFVLSRDSTFLDMHGRKNCGVSSRKFYVQSDFTVTSLVTRPRLYFETKRFPYWRVLPLKQYIDIPYKTFFPFLYFKYIHICIYVY